MPNTGGRRMSESVVGMNRNRWLAWIGIGGRRMSESVVGMNRNRWLAWIGIGGRHGLDYAPTVSWSYCQVQITGRARAVGDYFLQNNIKPNTFMEAPMFMTRSFSYSSPESVPSTAHTRTRCLLILLERRSAHESPQVDTEPNSPRDISVPPSLDLDVVELYFEDAIRCGSPDLRNPCAGNRSLPEDGDGQKCCVRVSF
jgi:hypothetical protein